ncbi:MAG TPA: LPS export ABC transporter periplasmic protein LptC [bacterium]|nr:LPS export ABC transporter periplasmic protein LptC [bacterium]
MNTAHTLWSAALRALLWAIPIALMGVLVWTLPPPRRAAPAPPAPAVSAPAVSVPAPRSGTTGGISQAPSSPSPAPRPYAQIRQGDLVGTDEAGHQRWRVVADDVTVVQDKQMVLLRHVRATFYQQDGTIAVTGQAGRYNTQTREIEITGNVHGESSNGRQLFADRLHWAPTSETITGSGHIRLVEDRVVMYADRMVSNVTLGQTQFFGHVHAADR